MTKPRGPKRGKGGKFLKRSDAQQDTPKERPAGQILHGGIGGGKTAAVEAQMQAAEAKIVKVVPSSRKRCEECGTELEYRTVRLYGMVLDIGSCPRHAPDPVSRILEMSR